MAKEETNPQESFINEFTRISQETILRQYESKNRERIADSPFAVRDAFDRQWLKVTGKSYYLPATYVEEEPKKSDEPIDPKSRKYLAKIRFKSVSWFKLPRRKIGRRFRELYNLKGIESRTGEERPIYMNQDIDQLSRLIGIENRDKIVQESKSTDHGEVEGPFDIYVEGYWQVQFSPQQSTSDTKDVRLMWEGQCLICQRMKKVVLPGWYIEVADNATRDHYTQTPEEGRKKIGTILEYPYIVMREATRAEYLAQKAEGDKIQREFIRREENG